MTTRRIGLPFPGFGARREAFVAVDLDLDLDLEFDGSDKAETVGSSEDDLAPSRG